MNSEGILVVGRWVHLVGGTRRAWRVLLIAFVVGLIGLGAGIWQAVQSPPFYQAQVILAVEPAHFRWYATSMIQTLQRPRNDARNMALVISQGPEVVNEVIRRMGDRLPPDWRSPEDLKRHLVARGGEGLYVYLTVNGTDPQLTYDVAQTWAQVVEERVETAFYRYDTEIPALEAQLQALEGQLREAEQAIEVFRTRTGFALVSGPNVAVTTGGPEGDTRVVGLSAVEAEWAQAAATLGEYRYAQRILRRLAEQVEQAVREGRAWDTVPLELVDELPPVRRRGEVSAAALRSLPDGASVAARLRAEADALQPAIDLLSAEVEALQRTLATYQTTFRDLVRRRDAVEGLYKAILAKRNELKAEAALASNYVTVVDVRYPKPSGTFNLVLHALAGFILGAFFGFLGGTTWYAVRKA